MNKLTRSPRPYRNSAQRSLSHVHLLNENEEDQGYDYNSENFHSNVEPSTVQAEPYEHEHEHEHEHERVHEHEESSVYHKNLCASYSIELSPKVLRYRRMGLSEEEMRKDIVEIRLKIFLQTMD